MTELDLKSLWAALATRNPGPFHFAALYGPAWAQLYIGDKVKYGHAFLNAVRAGKLPGVIDTGTKTGGYICGSLTGRNSGLNANLRAECEHRFHQGGYHRPW